MKVQRTTNIASILYSGVSILGLSSVSILSLWDPQATMDLVGVHLPNTDALSSIRGVYGGVGLTIVTGIVYLSATRMDLSVRFLTLFWGAYAVSRLITLIADGPLGDFGNQWITIETVLCLTGLILTYRNRTASS